MSLGKRLKQLRLAQGKTQKDVAESIGIAKSTYSLYESDKREPNVLSLKKLAIFTCAFEIVPAGKSARVPLSFMKVFNTVIFLYKRLFLCL